MKEYGPLTLFEQRTNEKIDMVPDDIKYENVLDRLKETEINKSYDVDDLNPTLLKNCASAFVIPLTLIFKESLEKSQLPVQFRSANVTPLHERKDFTRKLSANIAYSYCLQNHGRYR